MSADKGAGRPRVGVVGLRRGLYMAGWARRVGLDVVAVCDTDPRMLRAAADGLGRVRAARRWEELADADLDGVVLAGDFDGHAPLATAFLERGVHVLSETAACTGEEEGRRLIAAAGRSCATYSFAENFVAHPHVREVRRIVEAGEVGRVQSVEADYLHAMSPEAVAALVKDPSHWRGRIAPTAYCTHTVSPVLAVTGARPVEVSAFTVDEADPRVAVVLVVRLSTGALAVTRHGFLQGEPDAHWCRLSVRGTRGLVEAGGLPGERAWTVRVRTEAWAAADGVVVDEERPPPRLFVDGVPVDRAAEGTVRVLEAFHDTIAAGAPPLVGVRDAVAASLVGVRGAVSLARGSRPVTVPDVHGPPVG